MDKAYPAPNYLGESSGGNDDDEGNVGMIDYMLNSSLQQPQQRQHQPQLQPQHQISSGFGASPSFDKLNFADVMQFADFGPKLALNRVQGDQENGVDPVYFLKFPVLNDKVEDYHHMVPRQAQGDGYEGNRGVVFLKENDDQVARVSDNNNNDNSMHLQIPGEEREIKNVSTKEVKRKRKRAKTVKTSEEVESQRMTHIAVERNRRKQMNEHLRVLRSLMPGSYVQRGDQASIIGGAIEFVRELEHLLQCLESQKRRRILGEASHRQTAELSTPMIFSGDVNGLEGGDGGGPTEETAENKSCLADVEVKLLGFDAMIKILSRRRPGQLIKTIAALEDLNICILHTNITTIEQTVLYSFNVKIPSETRFTAEDIANSIQQIFSFIHANTAL